MRKLFWGFLGAALYDVVALVLFLGVAYAVLECTGSRSWTNPMAQIARALQ